MKKSKTAKVKLSLHKLSLDQIVTLSKQLVNTLSGNPDFQELVPATEGIAQSVDAVDSVRNDIEAMKRSLAAKYSLLEDKVSELKAKLRNTAAHIEIKADGEETIIRNSGLGIRATGGKKGVPDTPEFLHAEAVNHGSILLTWKSVTGAKSYNIEMTKDISGNTGWSRIMSVTKSKATISTLEAGIKYWFRVSVVGSAGESPVSEPISGYAV